MGLGAGPGLVSGHVRVLLAVSISAAVVVSHRTAAASDWQAPTKSESAATVPQPQPQAPAELDDSLRKAKSLLEVGQTSEAELNLRQYLKDHPNSADAHFLLGYTLFRKLQSDAVGQTQSTKYGVLDSLNIKSRQEMAKASLVEYTEGAKYHAPSAFDLKVVALDYVLLKDYPDADKWLTKSLQLATKDSEGWYYLGRSKYIENRFEEAIAAFQQCLKLDPNSVKVEDNLGLSYQGLGRIQDAAVAYRTAIAWQEHTLDQDSGPFINLGALLLDENQPQEAITYLVKAVAISPEAPRAHEHLGKAYEHVDQLAKAQAEFEKAVELAPQDASLHYVLGQIYRKEGLTERAKLEFDRSAALRESHASSEVPDR